MNRIKVNKIKVNQPALKKLFILEISKHRYSISKQWIPRWNSASWELYAYELNTYRVAQNCMYFSFLLCTIIDEPLNNVWTNLLNSFSGHCQLGTSWCKSCHCTSHQSQQYPSTMLTPHHEYRTKINQLCSTVIMVIATSSELGLEK